MKKILLFSALILAFLLLLPLSVLEAEFPSALPTSTKPESKSEKTETIKVLISQTGEIKEMSAEDYIFGVVAGEMPALYEKEALKAQAVCAYTFLKWRQKENSDKDYDITDDYTTDQCYISLSAAKEKWGDKADEYSEKIKSAINEVKSQTLTYDGEIILSVYHSLSSGKTESAKNVWGKDYPYLQAAESQDDKLAENYTSTKTLTFVEFKNAFKDKAELPENPADCFANWQRTPSGTVATVTVGNTEFKGSEIRALFDLKSSNFEVSTTDTTLTFTVYGYGHGVGMSQNGANQLAKRGKTYEQILKHYYKGCEIMRNS
ncbi:MAG: stage II sporulation protein D [Clostridia bacterium]|nr:stage II sporulation protein D [Clostridia bacterium]